MVVCTELVRPTSDFIAGQVSGGSLKNGSANIRAMRRALLFFIALSSVCALADDNPVILSPGATLDYGMGLNGKHYFALIREKAFSWKLTATPLVVTQVDLDWVQISSGQSNARKYLQHPSLRPGNVAIATLEYLTRPLDADKGQGGLSLQFVGDEIRLLMSLKRFVLKRDEEAIVLIGGGGPFVLSESSADYSAELEWAGDLDGDDTLDLIMSFERDHSVETCLFLSSMKMLNQPLANVGCSMASG